MGRLLVALEQDTVPALSGRDHLQTLAIVEAARAPSWAVLCRPVKWRPGRRDDTGNYQ
jgi:hypothetical protein